MLSPRPGEQGVEVGALRQNYPVKLIFLSAERERDVRKEVAL